MNSDEFQEVTCPNCQTKVYLFQLRQCEVGGCGKQGCQFCLRIVGGLRYCGDCLGEVEKEGQDEQQFV